MTWIACSFCHQCPCVCNLRAPVQTFTGTTLTPFTLTPATRELTDDEVTRIADRVLDKIGERIAVARAGWAKRFRGRVRWMERWLRDVPDDDEPTPGGES